MKAEIAKVRYLPTPRWLAFALILVASATSALLFFFGSNDPTVYAGSPTDALRFGSMALASVFGVWIATLDFSSGTLQRTLTAEPSRNRALLAKLAVGLLGSVLAVFVAVLMMVSIESMAAAQHGANVSVLLLAQAHLAVLPYTLLALCVGFGAGLLTRSMAGGMMLGFAVMLVPDTIMNSVSFLAGKGLMAYAGDLNMAIGGSLGASHGPTAAAMGILVWAVLVLAPGWVWFVRGDLK